MSTTTIDGIVYSIVGNIAYVGYYMNTSKEHNALDDNNVHAKSIVLKPYVNGFPVRTLLKFAFRYSEIEYIWIPKTVRTLGFDSLAYSSTLRTVIFESGSQLEVMEQGVFHKSKNIDRIVLPGNLKVINRFVFGDCGVKFIYYYGYAEINNTEIFFFDGQYRNFPDKVYVCRDAKFNHFGEFVDQEKIEKILSCPLFQLYTCESHMMLINTNYLFISLLLTK